MAWLSPLGFVGRTALSNYLLQSVVCTLLFYGYGMGLYRKLGPAITIFLTLLVFRAQIALSAWWLERYRFGPAEWLWRSLTYGLQPWKAEPGQSIRITGTSNDVTEGHRAFLDGVFFVLQRLTFIAAVAFAIVYFCMVGLRLSGNSRLPVGQPRRGVWDVADPALAETIDFFEDLSRGELGRVAPEVSGRDWEPAMQVLTAAYGDSARLLFVSVGLATVFGIVAGVLAAAWRQSGLALPMLTVTVVGISIPSFFLALLLQIGSIEFYQRTGIRLVLFGSHLPEAKSLLPKLALPALVLVARPLAHIVRVTFVSLSEVLEQDYVRTARAKGLREILVFWHHVLRNAGVGILTAVVVSLRFALGSLPVVEIFFDWPGLGVTMLNAIFQREASVVAGAALGLGVTFLLINMSLDLIYRVVDPRLRRQNNGGGP
jgi:peptide/nickel transport system permease protein